MKRGSFRRHLLEALVLGERHGVDTDEPRVNNAPYESNPTYAFDHVL